MNNFVVVTINNVTSELTVEGPCAEEDAKRWAREITEEDQDLQAFARELTSLEIV